MFLPSMNKARVNFKHQSMLCKGYMKNNVHLCFLGSLLDPGGLNNRWDEQNDENYKLVNPAYPLFISPFKEETKHPVHLKWSLRDMKNPESGKSDRDGCV